MIKITKLEAEFWLAVSRKVLERTKKEIEDFKGKKSKISLSKKRLLEKDLKDSKERVKYWESILKDL